MMRTVTLLAAFLCLAALPLGCARSENAERANPRAVARAGPDAGGKARNDRAKPLLVERRDVRPPFDEKEMVKPLNEFREYRVDDYRKLPNCLDVFSESVAVTFDGMTETQYKSAVSRSPSGPAAWC
jgi:hypothetical protein